MCNKQYYTEAKYCNIDCVTFDDYKLIEPSNVSLPCSCHLLLLSGTQPNHWWSASLSVEWPRASPTDRRGAARHM